MFRPVGRNTFSARKRTRRFFLRSMEMPAASEVRRGCGRRNKKMKGPLVRSQAAGLSTKSKRNVSALAGGFSHFRRPFFGAALHLLRSDSFVMLGKAPRLAHCA